VNPDLPTLSEDGVLLLDPHQAWRAAKAKREGKRYTPRLHSNAKRDLSEVILAGVGSYDDPLGVLNSRRQRKHNMHSPRNSFIASQKLGNALAYCFLLVEHRDMRQLLGLTEQEFVAVIGLPRFAGCFLRMPEHPGEVFMASSAYIKKLLARKVKPRISTPKFLAKKAVKKLS
jgi:hypothetical protein